MAWVPRALDVFALGRSLYEAWTGLDRFQFPSLPPRVIEASDWQTHGWQLNQILNEAAEKRPSHRIPSAELLLDRLQAAGTPRTRLSRRRIDWRRSCNRWQGNWSLHLPFASTVQSRVEAICLRNDSAMNSFILPALTCDWKNKLLYSIYSDARATFVQSVNLETFEHKEYSFAPTKNSIGGGIYLDSVQQLWGVENVTGNIVQFDTNKRTFTLIDQNPMDLLWFTGKLYFQ
jgi:serine/threonine protein kinase